MALERNVYKALESVVGSENISEDPGVLVGYQYSGMAIGEDTANRDTTNRDLTFEPFGGIKSEAIVLPGSTEEVQGIIRVCNRYKINYKAHSTGYGAHALPGVTNAIVVDLRRMNRIDIDEKNMCAVIEPYATGHQLQSEAMKRGLNCHIVTAGPNHSPLASATSFQGQGPSGLTTSTNQRNLLGVEWVTPTGEVMRMGAPGSGAGWFCGDGPGPDFRGIIRGFTGAAGGLGIFTKIGYKLYPWPGPPKPKRTGKVPQVGMETPENFKYYYAYWETWDDMTEATYQIHDARVAYTMVRTPPDVYGYYLTRTNNEFYKRYEDKSLPIRREHGMGWSTVIAGRTKMDFEYKEKVFEKILADTKGRFLVFTPEDEAVLLLSMVNPFYAQRLFRAKKSSLVLGGPTLSQLESVGLLKKLYETDEKCMKEYTKPGGQILNAGPEGTWGWSTEGRKLWTEATHSLDETLESLQQGREYSAKTIAAIQEARGAIAFDMRFVMGVLNDVFGPQMCDVQDWLRKIKKAFDPQDLSDHSGYISPEPAQLPLGLMGATRPE
jgi:glycolate oxidase